MIRHHHKKRRLMSEINVVPYIDVMLVLLVIFMVTAPMLTEGVKVDLPQAEARPISTKNQEPLEVTVTRKGEYLLNNRAIRSDDLRARVAALLRLHPDTPVVIRGDRRVAYDEVVQAMVLLQAAGAPSVGLITESPGK